MADRNSTGQPPAFLLSVPRPAVRRGGLVYTVADVAFTEFRRAVCAWSVAEAERHAHHDDAQAREIEALQAELALAKSSAQVNYSAAEQLRLKLAEIEVLLKYASEQNRRAEHAQVQEAVDRALTVAGGAR